MTDSVSSRRIRQAKLGMTVQPKKPSPYDALSEKMLAGAGEESNLEEQGVKTLRGRNKAAAKSQGRIPKIRPGGKGSSYA